jgi:hypothetical protein
MSTSRIEARLTEALERFADTLKSGMGGIHIKTEDSRQATVGDHINIIRGPQLRCTYFGSPKLETRTLNGLPFHALAEDAALNISGKLGVAATNKIAVFIVQRPERDAIAQKLFADYLVSARAVVDYDADEEMFHVWFDVLAAV